MCEVSGSLGGEFPETARIIYLVYFLFNRFDTPLDLSIKRGTDQLKSNISIINEK